MSIIFEGMSLFVSPTENTMGFDPANSIHSGEGVENIPLSPNWRVKETDLENWIEIFMKKIGRNTRFSRPLIDPEDLPKQPEPRPWDSIVTRWSYLTLGDEDSPDYPNAPGVKFRAAVNVITDNIAHENTISGGNSYFAASWYLRPICFAYANNIQLLCLSMATPIYGH